MPSIPPLAYRQDLTPAWEGCNGNGRPHRGAGPKGTSGRALRAVPNARSAKAVPGATPDAGTESNAGGDAGPKSRKLSPNLGRHRANIERFQDEIGRVRPKPGQTWHTLVHIWTPHSDNSVANPADTGRIRDGSKLGLSSADSWTNFGMDFSRCRPKSGQHRSKLAKVRTLLGRCRRKLAPLRQNNDIYSRALIEQGDACGSAHGRIGQVRRCSAGLAHGVAATWL